MAQEHFNGGWVALESKPRWELTALCKCEISVLVEFRHRTRTWKMIPADKDSDRQLDAGVDGADRGPGLSLCVNLVHALAYTS